MLARDDLDALREIERADAAVRTKLARLREIPRARRQWGTATPGGLLSENAAQRELPRTATPSPIAAYAAPGNALPSTATISPCPCAQSVGGAL